MTRALWMGGLAALAVACFPARLSADEGLSRQMQLGIQFFEKKDDAQAMDRFMEVLTKGDPAERPLANEYINLITHRMNTGEKVSAPALSKAPPAEVLTPQMPPPRPAKAAEARPAKAVPGPLPSGPEVVVEPVDDVERPPVKAKTPPTAPKPEPAPAPAPPAKPDKALMSKEIKAKIRALLERSVRALKSVEGVKVLMGEGGEPQAIAVPSAVLFQAGTSFQKNAGNILDALTGLSYSMSGAQIVVLPEGTASGDAKVLDMRRTMGVSAHLFSAGIAAARIKVNLLSSQVEIPRPLQDFRGIIVLFVANQPLGLVVDNSVGDEAGPPISLGVYPDSIRPDKAEGSIIEFSVQDPPAGLVSWSFKMLQPSAADGGDLTPLQEVMGGGPVYHQIYWNGRQNYFGRTLAAGRYECVITATDGKNRQRTLHRWIHLLAEAPPAAAPAAPAQAKAGAPLAELPQEASQKPAPLLKEGALRKKSKLKKKAKKVKRSRKKASAPKEEAPPAAGAAYTVSFAPGEAAPTPEGEKALSDAAAAAGADPAQTIELTGYAQTTEPDAAALAKKRADAAASALINKYKVDFKRVRVQAGVSDGPAPKVELKLAPRAK